MFELNNFDSIKIGIASPEKIREWSHGEVTKPETINYRTQKPEKDGLFCEKIFGPRKDWECHCGKYKRIRYKGVICDKCGVEVTKSKVRRERMGHIELAAPVTHLWFFRLPSKIGIILDMTPKTLESVVYYVNYVVTDPKQTDFMYKQVITDKEYRDAIEQYGYGSFEAGMGAEAIRTLLSHIDVEKESRELKEALPTLKGQKSIKAVKKLDVVESFLKSKNDPTSMIMTVIPVLPPELRPMVPLDGGRYATSDLNDLYRRVINRNNRLKKLIDLGAPEVIVRNEKRMLQESVDNLIDNGKRGKPVQGSKQRDLKSLSSMLGGKQGRFRQNLLGKRVDYSGRSVIVVGPELRMYQCGLPKEMALELFKPFIINKLIEQNKSNNIKGAKRMIEREKPVVWDILADVIKDHPVFLNRAPTLHRLSVQAFEPVLISGRAIKLHPSVCAAFNADFDGDQMSVHVPLSIDARTEARTLMLASNNILKLSDGEPVVTPAQDVVLGCCYLTTLKKGANGEGGIYSSQEEAIMAYQVGKLHMQAEITVKLSQEVDGKVYSKREKTSVGRLIFNSILPYDLGFIDRTKEENYASLQINSPIMKKQLSNILANAFDKFGASECSKLVDEIKDLGYKYSTLASITVNAYDAKIPAVKSQIMEESEKKVLENEKMFKRGLITLDEKLSENIKVWNDANSKCKDAVIENLEDHNPLKVMILSGARGNAGQLNFTCGMVGLKSNASGEKVDSPIKSNFVTGLSSIEYFLSARGSRKGLMDTAMKTADSGYLTRRLVDVAQDVVVKTEDCFADLEEDVKGSWVSDLIVDGNVQESLAERIYGRVTVDDVINPITKEVIVNANEMISKEQSEEIEKAGIKKIQIRNLLTCKCKNGVCAKCYGRNLAGQNMVPVGEAVGIIGAQSIGEPGTQLTMRTFHTGGSATAADITQGLPRIEEIFEARKPKGECVLAEVSGKIKIKEDAKHYYITVVSKEDETDYEVKKPAFLAVRNGDSVEPGSQLTLGAINPTDLLRLKGVKGLQDYLLSQVISTYRSQDVKVNDKHVEIIIRQMLKKVRIETSGDTNLLPGQVVDVATYEDENMEVFQNDGQPASAKRILLGITKASLSTESFLSAASFQETSRVLTDAAIRGKVDRLAGLKENIIIGKLIPAGTGLKKYRDVMPLSVEEEEIV